MSAKTRLWSGEVGDTDIRLLRIFKVVAENGGFAAAEVELNISRPAISVAIADLEARVGFKLCHRGRAGFSLTEEGKQVYQSILQLFASLEGFRTEVNALHAHLRGELNIGITDNMVTMPRMQVTHALRGLKQRGPQVRVNIRMMPPNEIEMGVLDGRLHVGVVPELRPLSGLEYLSLYDETSRLYCSFEHPLFEVAEQPISVVKLARYDAVIPAYVQSAEVKRHVQMLRSSATATDREGVAFLILTGCFIGFLPTHFAAKWVGEGKMRALEGEYCRFQTHYSVITRRASRAHLVLDTYMEELHKLLGNEEAVAG